MSKENNNQNTPNSNDMLNTQDLSQISEILDMEFGDSDLTEPKDTDSQTTSASADSTTAYAEQHRKSAEKAADAVQPNTVGSAKAASSKGGKGLPKKNAKKQKSTASTVIKYLLIIALILMIAGGVGIFVLYQSNRVDISNVKYQPKEKTEIYSADNVKIAELYNQNREYISIDQVPEYLKEALIATEDSRFYSHNGVDYIGVLRAFLSNLVSGSGTGQGASTITQQLARLLYLPDISTEQTFMDSLNRKFKEISIAYQLEEKYTKDQILEMYLNEYYFGSGAYGIEAAAKTYFGKSVSQLDLAECAMLAGLPQAPSVYAPNNDFEAAKKRQLEVLDRMVAMGYITQEQADEAYNEQLNILPFSADSLENQIEPGYEAFVDQVLNEYATAAAPTVMKEQGLSEEDAIAYTKESIASGGYILYTTIYSTYQSDAISVAESSGLDQADGDTCAIVTVDLDGAVRCYYGGNENYSEIDMASRARQPGSNIKPLYYSLALDSGQFTINSTLTNEPVTYGGGYTPRNYGGSSNEGGTVTLSSALINSLNIPSTALFNALGVDNAINWIKTFGISTFTDDDANLAVATGGMTDGIMPLEMAAAYNVFNNSGVYNQPFFIEKVTDSTGELIADKSSLGLVSRQVMSATTAQQMWSLLRQVVTSGTGGSASTTEQTAGKTGTTDNSEDLWFTGMTGNLTTSIWVGNLDHAELSYSSSFCAALYRSYMQTLLNEGLVYQFNPENTPVMQDFTNAYVGPDGEAQ